MKITPLQRKNLKALFVQRTRGVSVWGTLARAKLALFAHVLIGGGGAFYVSMGGPLRTAGLLLVGFAVGSYVRIIRTAITAAHVWPAFVEIVDWQKAETLLRENENA